MNQSLKKWGPKIVFSKNVINYGSLGSLIFFLKKHFPIPDKLIINYLDKNFTLRFYNLVK